MTSTLPEEAVFEAAKAITGPLRDPTEWELSQFKLALTAAIPFIPVQGVVKKLEWIEIPACNGLNTARTEFGTYTIGSSLVARYGLKSISKPLATLEAAKAAAQADYEARILSALEPSAARELALEEAARNAAMYLATGFITCPRCGEDVETKNTDAEYTLRAALSSPEPSDHRETVLYEAARKAQKAIAAILASGGLESDKWWDDLVSAQQSLATAIRALSSPDHADAGKVEGDVEKWSIREIVAKAIAYHSVGDPHAKTIRGDQRWEWFVEEADKFISVFGYYLPAIPSALASEGAE